MNSLENEILLLLPSDALDYVFLHNRIPRSRREQAIVVSDQQSVTDLAAKDHLGSIDIRELLNAEDQIRIADEASDLMHHWHECLDFQFLDVPIADVYVQDYGFFASKLRFIRLVEILSARYPIKKIYTTSERLALVKLAGVAPNLCVGFRQSSFMIGRRKLRRKIQRLRSYANFAGFSGILREKFLSRLQYGGEKIRLLNGNRSPLLFICSYTNHVILIAPVLDEAKKNGTGYLVVATNENPTGELQKRGIPYVMLSDFRTQASQHQSTMAIKETRIKINERSLTEAIDRTSSAHKALLKNSSQQLYMNFIKRKFPKSIKRVALLNSLYEAVRPRLVLVADDTSEEGRSAVLLAKAKGIMSVHLQHGEYGDMAAVRHVCADVLLCWSNSMKHRFMDVGVEGKRIIVTGSPRYELLLNEAKLHHSEEIRRRLGLANTSKVILWAPASDAIENDKNSILRKNQGLEELLTIIQAIRGMADCILVIKTHPLAYQINYESITRNYDFVRLLHKENTFELLSVADIVVSWNSGIIYEAAMLSKPVVGLNLFKIPDLFGVIESGIAVKAEDKDQFKKAVIELLEDVNRREVVLKKQKECLDTDYPLRSTNASKRVFDVLMHYSRIGPTHKSI